MEEATSTFCIFCAKSLSDGQITRIGEKGLSGIQRAAAERQENIELQIGQYVHTDCRSVFINPKYVATAKQKKRNLEIDESENTDNNNNMIKNLRSNESRFDIREHCLFCGKIVSRDDLEHGNAFEVKTKNFDYSVRETCKVRCDSWSHKVLGRVLGAPADLFASDAIYHQICSVNFRTLKAIPQRFADSTTERLSKKGRPQEDVRHDAFMKVTQYLEENDEEQISISDLITKMREYLSDTGFEAYSQPYMKKKLLDFFGDHLYITDLNGYCGIVTLRQKASEILQECYAQPRNVDINEEKKNIVKSAAELIKAEIKNVEVKCDYYPNKQDGLSSVSDSIDVLPELLRLLLDHLFVGRKTDVKLAAIGQAIMQAVRPRALSMPLQFGLGVQLHHHFGSKFLVETLHNMGFCCSYAQVQMFEKSAAVCLSAEPNIDSNDNFIQFVADNVDHNIVTLDGRNTFHGMGMIGVITPKKKKVKPIPKLSISNAELIMVGKINILHYKTKAALQQLVYAEHVPIDSESGLPLIDIMWKVSWPMRPTRPNWSGTMQTFYHSREHVGVSTVDFLPIIDLNPSDISCVYTTLHFIAKQAQRSGLPCIVTFDQPLWWKALQIISSEPAESPLSAIVLRLGGFHTLMSFLGCIGHIMSGSGLTEAISEIYSSTVVNHILSGKAFSRAVRCHFLLDTCLNAFLLQQVSNICMPWDTDDMLTSNSTACESEKENQISADTTTHQILESDKVLIQTNSSKEQCDNDMQILLQSFDRIIQGNVVTDEVALEHAARRVEETLRQIKNALSSRRTARLWLQYMELIDILRDFIRAERTSDWGLHLNAMSRMLPFFAASGHNLYAKSCRIYLQMMSDLATRVPYVHKKFEDGYHTIRRSDKFWCGLSTDLVIEQVLMRSIKSTGGLTRGRGMTDAQRSLWLLSMPACASINDAMMEITNVAHATSEQHKDLSEARRQRDAADILKVARFVAKRNPFTSTDERLFSIYNGNIAHGSVNVDNSKNIGNTIMQNMTGCKVESYVFRKSARAVTMADKFAVKIDDEQVAIDPQLLFQRLIASAQHSIDDLRPILKYELCQYPPALVDTDGTLRKANKPVLADALWKLGGYSGTEVLGAHEYVIDGGYLLHKVPWPRGCSFDQLLKLYCDYMQKYPKAVIVFDGYGHVNTTKDVAHSRRASRFGGLDVNVNENMAFSGKQDDFLSNRRNKEAFTHMLGKYLSTKGFSIKYAEEDADCLIVQTAINLAKTVQVVVIGEDTDIVVLLVHHWSSQVHKVYFTSEAKHGSKKPARLWDIKHVQDALGKDVCNNILFAHAILGCDTTSGIYGIGKGQSLSKLQVPNFLQQASIFLHPNISKEIVIEAGERALVCLFNGKHVSLDQLRYEKFCEKVARSTSFIEPQSLPPTSAAAKYHSMRVYLQVQTWLGRTLQASDWGWKLSEGMLQPILTDIQPAPDFLIKVVRCNCKTDCSSARCSCKKQTLPCNPACGNCHGTSCMNVSATTADDQSDIDDDN